MPKLTKADRAKLRSAGPTEDYHPTVVDRFTDADGEDMVELADGNIEPAEIWVPTVGDRVEVYPIEDADGNPGYLVAPVAETQVVAAEVYDAPTGGELVEFTPPRPELPTVDRTKKPLVHIHGTKNPYVSGFCGNERRITEGTFIGSQERGAGPATEALHTRCKGGVITGQGQVILCQCPAHLEDPRCLICGNPGGEDLDEFRLHRDPEDCADVLHQQAIESAKSPVSRMIREIQASVRATPEQIDGLRRKARELGGSPPERRQGRPCQCGCGLMTGGGLFRPGHDARLKSTLRKADGSGINLAEQIARGWDKGEGNDESRLAAQGLIDHAGGPEAFILSRVAARYAEAAQEDQK